MCVQKGGFKKWRTAFLRKVGYREGVKGKRVGFLGGRNKERDKGIKRTIKKEKNKRVSELDRLWQSSWEPPVRESLPPWKGRKRTPHSKVLRTNPSINISQAPRRGDATLIMEK